MFFTPNGVEQSTRASRRRRTAPSGFAGAGRDARVADLCCGIGGDAIALARAGIRVLAVDRDPLTAAVARANAEALGLADLIEVRERGRHRGRHGRRTTPCSSTRPGAAAGAGSSTRRRTRRRCPGRSRRPARRPHAALKIAPGIPHEAVPAEAEAEWISDGGDVKEAVLWFGTARRARVRATLLPGPRILHRPRRCPTPRSAPVGRYLYEPDGAVIRAHLVAEVAEELDGGLIDETIAYITADELRADAVRHRVRDHRRTPLQPEEVEGAAAGARGRHPDREEARLGGRAGGTAPQGEAAGAELGDGLPDPGRGGADDADRTACVSPVTARRRTGQGPRPIAGTPTVPLMRVHGSALAPSASPYAASSTDSAPSNALNSWTARGTG